MLSFATKNKRDLISGQCLLDEHGDDCGGHQVGQGSGNHRTEAEAGEVVAALGNEGSDSANLDANGAEVGKTAESKRSDGKAAGRD